MGATLVLSQYQPVTDRQTDRRPRRRVAMSRSNIAERDDRTEVKLAAITATVRNYATSCTSFVRLWYESLTICLRLRGNSHARITASQVRLNDHNALLDPSRNHFVFVTT